MPTAYMGHRFAADTTEGKTPADFRSLQCRDCRTYVQVPARTGTTPILELLKVQEVYQCPGAIPDDQATFKGHIFRPDPERTRRLRDVRVLVCTLCRRSVRVPMRTKRPLGELIESQRLMIAACPGSPPEPAPLVCDHGTVGCKSRGEKHWCEKPKETKSPPEPALTSLGKLHLDQAVALLAICRKEVSDVELVNAISGFLHRESRDSLQAFIRDSLQAFIPEELMLKQAARDLWRASRDQSGVADYEVFGERMCEAAIAWARAESPASPKVDAALKGKPLSPEAAPTPSPDALTVIQKLLRSAHPNAKEHPTMTAAWREAEAFLRGRGILP